MDGNQTRLILLFLIGLLALTAVAVWLLSPDDAEDGTIPEQERAAAEDSEPVDPVTDVESSPDEKVPIVPEPPPATSETGKSRIVFAGTVVDAATDKPVTSFEVWVRQLKRIDGGRLDPYPPWQKEPFKSPEGRFSIPLKEGGSYIFRYGASGYQRPDHVELFIPEDGGVTGYVLELTPGLTISGRVVEDATNRPIEGAVVTPYLIRSFTRHGDTVRPEVWSDGKPAKTGADGTFTVTDLRAGPHRLWARHPDFAEAHADGETGGENVEIRLGSGFRFYGEVRDTLGRQTPGIDVHFFSFSISTGQDVKTGPDGRYRTPPLPPGSYTLSTTEIDKEDGTGSTVLKEMKSCDLVDQDVEVNFGLQEGQVVWRGTLFDGDGVTVPNAKITLLRGFDSRDRGGRKPPRTSICRSKTDANGDFEIGPLDLWVYDIDVVFAENTLINATNRVDRIEFDQPGLITRDIHLRRTELSGYVIEEKTGKPWLNSRGWVMAASGRGKIYNTSIGADGRFRFRGIEPATYFLSADGLEAAQGRLDNIVIEDNQVIDDLRIVIPFTGKFSLRVTGLEAIRNQNFSIKIESTEDDRGWNFSGGGCTVDHTGTCNLSTSFEAGPWKVTVSHPAIGSAEKTFTIEAGKTAEIEMGREEFSSR